jgi:cytochrome c biogenesis protein CcdA/thiol-disulfide isomerase/thioredoxin
MVILLVFAFASGLITILAPCIWPLLPVILSSSSTGGKLKPFGVTLGIMFSFTVFTLTLSYLVRILHFDPNILRLIAVVVIAFLGVTLAVPSLTRILEGALASMTGRFGPAARSKKSGFTGGFVTGSSLGLVWSPCAGPILATIATLAATQAVSLQVVALTVTYVVGIGIPLFLFASAGKWFFTKSRSIAKYTPRIQQVFGVIMIVTALAIYTNYDKTVEARLLDFVPSYSSFINQFEGHVQTQLNTLKPNSPAVQSPVNNAPKPVAATDLPDLGAAADFTGITHWLNTPAPLKLADLKGKVVLVDFWTYSCINCIRTLPYVTGWYDKYKDQGFVVVGVHTPEFEFEKTTANVQNAINQFNIHYPVAQDNNYATWNAYNNEYWPADYLVDAKGHVRVTHFGEGAYDETEMDIKALLTEAGKSVDQSLVKATDQTPTGMTTPETYVGMDRMGSFAMKSGPHGGRQLFTPAETIPADNFALEGWWDEEPQYAQPDSGSALNLNFTANRAYLVITPKQAGDKIKVLLDGKVIDNGQAGADVKDGIITLDKDRLYDLVNLQGNPGKHLLRLEFLSDGIEVYAFTFG